MMRSPTAAGQPSFIAAVATAWLAVAFLLFLEHWPQTGHTMPDADDAMRLVELRAFLAGQGWFDLHEPRIAPPWGYDTHWSRLLDLGLAGLYGVLHWFADQPLAERLLRAIWPLMWLAPAMFAVMAIAWRLAGRGVALVVVLIFLVGDPAYHQFRPGRIDHHNVQIALALLVLAASVWADRRLWAAWAAGAFTGLALAIGLEGLPFLAFCGAAFALRYVVEAGAAASLRAYALALAASTVVAFFLSVGPAHWTQSACDALAVNLAVPVIVSGLALALCASFPSHQWAGRAAAIGIAGAAAAALFIALDPRCVAGPYAGIDAAVWPAWLSHVREMQPLTGLFHQMPLVAAAIAAFPAAAILAMLLLAREPEFRTDPAFLLVSVTVLAAVVITLGATKAFSYAIWFGMPLVAAAGVRLLATLRLTMLASRASVALLLTPTAISAGAIMAADAAGLEDSGRFSDPDDQACMETANYATVARLPPGLVATDVRYGPFFLAWTPHSVLAAPYHRLPGAIILAQRAMAAKPAAAHDILLNTGADYVVVCGSRMRPDFTAAEQTESLWAEVKVGLVPDWLEPIAETQKGPLLAFRIKR